MATGAQTTSEELNAAACALALEWAKTANNVIALAKFVDGLGLTGLEAAGFGTTEDATAYKNCVDLLKTVAMIFQGTAIQPDQYDFSNALSAFIGPAYAQ